MQNDLKILVAGPKRSGKTMELIRICYDMNLPFVVANENQYSATRAQCNRLSFPIKVKFVEELIEDGYEGPIVIERAALFGKFEWEYIKRHCVIYAESREVARVISTDTPLGAYLSWLLAGFLITFSLYYFGGMRFAGVFGFFVGFLRLLFGFINK
jgi:hypothetical protein